MNDTLNELLQLSPPVALLIAINMLGYALKRSPVRSDLIPFIALTAGAVAYPFVARDNPVAANSLGMNVIIGFCIGGASVGLHQGVRSILNMRTGNTKIDPVPKTPDKEQPPTP